jgi:hypothetical protein
MPPLAEVEALVVDSTPPLAEVEALFVGSTPPLADVEALVVGSTPPPIDAAERRRVRKTKRAAYRAKVELRVRQEYEAKLSDMRGEMETHAASVSVATTQADEILERARSTEREALESRDVLASSMVDMKSHISVRDVKLSVLASQLEAGAASALESERAIDMLRTKLTEELGERDEKLRESQAELQSLRESVASRISEVSIAASRAAVLEDRKRQAQSREQKRAATRQQQVRKLSVMKRVVLVLGEQAWFGDAQRSPAFMEDLKFVCNALTEVMSGERRSRVFDALFMLTKQYGRALIDALVSNARKFAPAGKQNEFLADDLVSIWRNATK